MFLEYITSTSCGLATGYQPYPPLRTGGVELDEINNKFPEQAGDYGQQSSPGVEHFYIGDCDESAKKEVDAKESETEVVANKAAAFDTKENAARKMKKTKKSKSDGKKKRKKKKEETDPASPSKSWCGSKSRQMS